MAVALANGQWVRGSNTCLAPGTGNPHYVTVCSCFSRAWKSQPFYGWFNRKWEGLKHFVMENSEQTTEERLVDIQDIKLSRAL